MTNKNNFEVIRIRDNSRRIVKSFNSRAHAENYAVQQENYENDLNEAQLNILGHNADQQYIYFKVREVETGFEY